MPIHQTQRIYFLYVFKINSVLLFIILLLGCGQDRPNNEHKNTANLDTKNKLIDSIPIDSMPMDSTKVKTFDLSQIIDSSILSQSYFTLTIDTGFRYLYYFDGKKIVQRDINNNYQILNTVFVSTSINLKKLATSLVISNHKIGLLLTDGLMTKDTTYTYLFLEYNYNLEHIKTRKLYFPHGMMIFGDKIYYYSYIEDTLHKQLQFTCHLVNSTTFFENDTVVPHKGGDVLFDLVNEKIYKLVQNRIYCNDILIVDLSNYVDKEDDFVQFTTYNNKIFWVDDKYEYEYEYEYDIITKKILKRINPKTSLRINQRFNKGTFYISVKSKNILNLNLY